MTKIRIALSKVTSRVEENGLKWRRKDVKGKKRRRFPPTRKTYGILLKATAVFSQKLLLAQSLSD